MLFRKQHNIRHPGVVFGRAAESALYESIAKVRRFHAEKMARLFLYHAVLMIRRWPLDQFALMELVSDIRAEGSETARLVDREHGSG
jgi:hypothetical protein